MECPRALPYLVQDLELFGSDLPSAEFESFFAVTKLSPVRGKRQMVLKSNAEVLVFLCLFIPMVLTILHDATDKLDQNRRSLIHPGPIQTTRTKRLQKLT